RAHDARIRQVTARYADTRRAIACANSLGDWAEDDRVQIILSVTAVASDGAELLTGYDTAGGGGGLGLFARHTPEAVGAPAAGRALNNLLARPAPAGRMPVVLSSSAGGTFVHEAVGHGLEADLVDGGLSIYAGRIGEQIGSPLVTVIDDATLPGRRGSFGCD